MPQHTPILVGLREIGTTILEGVSPTPGLEQGIRPRQVSLIKAQLPVTLVERQATNVPTVLRIPEQPRRGFNVSDI